MTYPEALDWMYTQLPMYQRLGQKAFKKDLTNIRKLCAALDQPHTRFPCLHIAGTNGKGSTAHLLAGALQEQGFKVGLYTSPHYRDFRERIRINGKMIGRKAVAHFIATHQPLFDEIQPSFFEITVALAFDYFARRKVDIAVIETGLGGRLDSTNVVTPLLSIITNISFDHQAMLGNTLTAIAREKAGIIKPGVPVVIGETHPETRPIFEGFARRNKSTVTFADQQLQLAEFEPGHPHSQYRIEGLAGKPRTLKVEVHGLFQARNLVTAMVTLRELERVWSVFQFNPDRHEVAWRNLPERTGFKGRWQRLGDRPLTIADSAHNEAGIRQTLYHLSRIPHQKLHIVLGMVNDKDRNQILPLFPTQARYYFARPDIPRGLDAELLKADAAAFHLQGTVHNSVRNALRAARRYAEPDDLIFVGGSTFVVAEVV